MSYHEELATIREKLTSEGYAPQRTNKTEFVKRFEGDQEGTIFARKREGQMELMWNYRSSGVVLERGLTRDPDEAVSKIAKAQQIDPQVISTKPIEKCDFGRTR